MMRAKVKCTNVTDYGNNSQTVVFNPVSSGSYGPNGESEDNTFARYTPAGEIKLSINNPALYGKIKLGQLFYVDFTIHPDSEVK